MSRKSSGKQNRRQNLHRSISSIEFLESRTLLSTATINAASTVRIVPSDMLGVNTAPWDSLLNSAATLSLSKAAGIDAVRIGGGSTADTWHFNSTTQSESIGEMADYVANLNATGIATVDYGEGSPQEGVALWAYLNGSPTDTYAIGNGEQWNGSSWVSVNWNTVGYWASLRAGTTVSKSSLGANHAAAFNVPYFEIGNEIYGSWETDEHGGAGDTLPMPTGDTSKAHNPTTLVSFAEQFQSEVNAIINDGSESGAVPISVGIDSQSVATTGGGSFSDWIGKILSQSVSQHLTLGFIADHYYTATSPGSETDSGLLAVSNTTTSNSSSSNPYGWSERATDYDNLIAAAESAGGANGVTYLGHVGLIADEVNSLSSSPGQQSVSLVNGLFIADALGSSLDTSGADGFAGYSGFWIWDLHNGAGGGLVSSSLYGWRQYGDYGIIGNGSPASVNEPSPDYFAIQLASKFIQPGGEVVSATEDNESSIDTFAILEPNGHLDLMVINKTETGLNNNTTGTPQLLTETFNISGFIPTTSATVWQYGSVQDNQQEAGTTPTLANSVQSISVSGGSFTFALPSYSMTVIDLTPDAGPTVAKAAAAAPNPVTGTSTGLSVLGAENGSDTGLIYTWSYTGPSGVTYSGAANGTNAAKNITAIFTQAGSYNFTATITDPSNLSTTSMAPVTVQQTPTTIVVSPNTSPVVPTGFTQQFSASATDQFGNDIASPSFTWGIGGSENSISSSGDATLGSTPGSFTVTATDGSAQGMATVIAENFAVPSGSTLEINLGSAGPVSISASGANITASQNGLQITLSGFTGVTVTDTASGDVLNFNGNLALPFTFVNTGNSTVNVNNGTLIFAAVPGGAVPIGNLSVAAGASAMITAATTNSPTTLALNTLSITPTGSLDVANNEVLINYGTGTDPISTIAGWIASGYAGGAWTGSGIFSSVAQSNSTSYGLGYADSADAGNPANLATGQIEILYTLLGDANLDGKVNGTDFNLMADNFNQAVTAGWDKGDFNYDNAVNGNDFVLLADNFNQFAQIAVPAVAVGGSDASQTSTNAPNMASFHQRRDARHKSHST